MKKQVLGRGLGALIDDAAVDIRPAQASSINEIEIDSIVANPFQPRKEFDEESLQELAASIKQLGIIQPITVRKIENNQYQLITGERRFRAATLAGIEKIPAYIRTADDQGMLEMALVENIQREDLNAIEIAISYQRLIEECNITQENLGDRVGKKRSTITNYLRLLKLPAEIQIGLRENKISMGHARALVTIEDAKTQLKIFNQTVKQNLSVRQVEELVKKISQQQTQTETIQKEDNRTPTEYKKLHDQLKKYFGNRVEFKRTVSGSGKIVIPFRSDEELEQLLNIFDNFKKE